MYCSISTCHVFRMEGQVDRSPRQMAGRAKRVEWIRVCQYSSWTFCLKGCSILSGENNIPINRTVSRFKAEETGDLRAFVIGA